MNWEDPSVEPLQSKERFSDARENIKTNEVTEENMSEEQKGRIVKEYNNLTKDLICKHPTGPLQVTLAVADKKLSKPGNIYKKKTETNSRKAAVRNSNPKETKENPRKGPIPFDRGKYQNIKNMFENIGNIEKDEEEVNVKGKVMERIEELEKNIVKGLKQKIPKVQSPKVKRLARSFGDTNFRGGNISKLNSNESKSLDSGRQDRSSGIDREIEKVDY